MVAGGYFFLKGMGGDHYWIDLSFRQTLEVQRITIF